MRKILSGLCATTLAASFAIASAVPVNAAPVFVPQPPVAQSDIIQVQSDERTLRARAVSSTSFSSALSWTTSIFARR